MSASAVFSCRLRHVVICLRCGNNKLLTWLQYVRPLICLQNLVFVKVPEFAGDDDRAAGSSYFSVLSRLHMFSFLSAYKAVWPGATANVTAGCSHDRYLQSLPCSSLHEKQSFCTYSWEHLVAGMQRVLQEQVWRLPQTRRACMDQGGCCLLCKVRLAS